MISSSQTTEPSAHIKSRAKKMHVRTLSPFTYLVIPEPGKVPRIVHFDLCQDTGVVRIECYARETGIGCEANTYSALCSHVFAAVERLLQNAKRLAAKEAKQEPIDRVKRLRQFAQLTLDSRKQRELIPK